MSTSLYGPDGFYRRNRPAAHFRTSVTVSARFAEAVARLLVLVDRELGRPAELLFADVGAAGGELITRVTAALPDVLAGRVVPVGVDLAARPPWLPAHVRWCHRLPAGGTGLVLAHELLDNIPVDVVMAGPTGPRTVEVGGTGTERLGHPAGTADLAWLARWWPLRPPPGRAEVGRYRDRVWAGLVGRLHRGLAVAVDYPARPDRQHAGTLTGHRGGRQVPPVPDGSCDLTAHVLLASCAAAGRAAGAGAGWLLPQSAMLPALGVRSARPPAGRPVEPARYLNELCRSTDAAVLLDPAGLGARCWLVQPVRMRPPRVFATGVPAAAR